MTPKTTGNHVGDRLRGNPESLSDFNVTHLSRQGANLYCTVHRELRLASSTDVHRRRHWLKVSRVYASGIATEMINYQPVRDWSKDLSIKESMRCMSFPRITDPPVSRWVFRPLPKPTARQFINEIQRALLAPMALHIPDGLPLDVPTLTVGVIRNLRLLTATALAQTFGDAIVVGHDGVPSLIAMPRGVRAPPGSLVPKL